MRQNSTELATLIKAAKGEYPVDLLLEGGNLINVLSGEIYQADVAIFQNRVVGFGQYEAKKHFKIDGKFICPGFIDAHFHLESTLLTPQEFACAVAPMGTSSVILDPHEIANVFGMMGIEYLYLYSKNLPLTFYFTLPSCVPATHLETSGAILEAEDLKKLIRKPWIVGLGELMNFPGLISADPQLLKKIQMSIGKCKDGHAPLLMGKNLYAYLAAGIESDHECTRLDEAQEKLRAGMHIMLREGSTAKNVTDLLPLVTPTNSQRCMLVSDDKSPSDLLHKGHLNTLLKKVVAQGLDPIIALQMVTINPATYFGLRQIGAIAPGFIANIAILDDLKSFNAHMVFHQGKLVAQGGQMKDNVLRNRKSKRNQLAKKIRHSIQIKPLDLVHLQIPLASPKKARVIQIIPNQIITHNVLVEIEPKEGKAISDPAKDILKLIVVERHQKSGRIGLGLVKGMGLKAGAMASSVAHDSHNIIAVGVGDEDILLAVKEVEKLQGGWVVYKNGQLISALPLPIAGLLSEWSIEKTAATVDLLNQKAASLGCKISEPFLKLSFLALPVIPELKLTDKGLIDVNSFQHVPLFMDK